MRFVLINLRIPNLEKRVASTISQRISILSSLVIAVLLTKSKPVSNSTTA
jgi:hypothetical protein